jgi:DNA replication ATP-dependent helicase Dna2
MITFKDPSSFIIHHPDLMLTMTSIANAMPCPRKPILQSLLKVPGPPTKAILYGNIQHGLLQSSLTEQSFEEESTRRRLDEELRKESSRLEIWGAGMDVQEIKMDLGARAGRGFEVFANKWVGPQPKVCCVVHELQRSGEWA